MVIDKEFILSVLKKMVEKYPKFSKVIKKQNGNLYWESVKIKYKNHYKILNKNKYDEKKHHQLIEKIMNKKLSENIPKHKWYIVNYPSRCFIVTKFCHSYGDGDFMIQKVLKEIFGHSNVETVERNSNINGENIIKKLCMGIYYFVVSLFSILYFLFFYKKDEIFDIPSENCRAKFKEVYI